MSRLQRGGRQQGGWRSTHSVGDTGDINVSWELASKGILQLGAWAPQLDFLHLNPGLEVYEVCDLE